MRSPKHPNTLRESYFIVRAVLSCLLFFFLITNINAQTWTWMGGTNSVAQTGVYGSKGVADVNNRPGNRFYHSGWKDAAGNFWLFGGLSSAGPSYNDLWKYNPNTGEWTWVSGDNTGNALPFYGAQGFSHPSNKPGARYGAASWTDPSGNFWLYGGTGYDVNGSIGNLNDLWKFNTTTNEWIWMNGNTTLASGAVYGSWNTPAVNNRPGARSYSTGWADAAGNCWIFGGTGDAGGSTGYLSDLWKYDPTINQWAWLAGQTSANTNPVYGPQGTANVSFMPGARARHTAWIDANGKFWLFGGLGYIGGTLGNLNDLWKYDPVTYSWTWVSGENLLNRPGVYGTKGTAAVNNKPGGRFALTEVSDAAGNFWFWGGYGNDEAGTQGYLNDLWQYNPATNQWTWHNGDKTAGNASVYGVQGTGNTANKQGGRCCNVLWNDAAGKLWTFGGWGSPAGVWNDLWQFNSLTALPLQLITLRGSKHNNEYLLNWETIGEENTSKFNVEKSTDGVAYVAVDSVAAIGSGNNNYSYTDRDPSKTTSFYRIQAVDHNGHTTYSPIIRLNVSADARIDVYPNPVKNSVTIEFTDNSLLNTTAKIFTVTGQLAGEVIIKNLKQVVDLNRYSKGLLTIRFNNGKVITVVKQ